jgi:MYXO-CTERM domain-containing protein
VPTNKVHAIEWLPVPEPQPALILAIVSLAALALRRNPRRQTL